MSDEREADRVTGELHEFLTEKLTWELHAGRPFRGLRWSPDMPDDEPDAEYLVIDGNGVEYVLELDVWLHATGKTHNQEETK